MPVQTEAEIRRVVNEGCEGYMPADFLETQHNLEALGSHCHNHYAIVSITNLNKSIETLRKEGKLDVQKPLTLAEQRQAQRERAEKLAAKELIEQIEADAANRVPFNPNKGAEEQKAKDDAAKEQELARAFCASKISQWSVNAGPNRIDHRASEEGQALLRTIRITWDGGKTIDWVASKRVLLQLFNSETVGQIRQAIPAAIAALNESKQPVNQKALDARKSVGPANLPIYSR